MPLKFDITLTAEDMYRFNMYQTYSGFHGWFSIAFSILIFVVAGVTRGKIEAAYTALYIVFGKTPGRGGKARRRLYAGGRSGRRKDSLHTGNCGRTWHHGASLQPDLYNRAGI